MMEFLRKNPSSLPRASYGGTGKRLFLGLMCGSCFLLCFLLFLVWLVPYIGLSAIHSSLPFVLGFLTALVVAAIAWLCLSLAYHVYTGRHVPGLSRVRGLTIRLMFPLMELLGRALGVPREKIRLSFVKVNNEMVLASHPQVQARDILLLLPHCLQRSLCERRLNHNVNHCLRCGLCPVGRLLDLRDTWGCSMVLASGGTVARRIVVEKKPRLILAVACERDLTSGIQDTYPLPVFGVLNERPLGPCLDTTVEVALLEEALHLFVPAGAAPTDVRGEGNHVQW